MSTRPPVRLRGLTWNHTRGLLPLAATAQLFSESHPGVEIAWDKRSLQEFADAPLDRHAERYDFLVIDHPWAGHAASRGILLPLDEHLPRRFLSDQKAQQVGCSHDSYHFDGRQTALAIDAAAPVASWRPDLIDAVPRNGEEILALARRGRVVMPGKAIDLLMHFYMICIAFGEAPFQRRQRVVAPDVGECALEWLRALAAFCSREIFGLDPIGVYRRLAAGRRESYCPFAYGYSNYARRGYAPHRLAFGDLARVNGRTLRSTLGGTGLAVSARTRHREVALEYVRMVASPEVQRTVYTASGGQPGHRSAWLDPENDGLTAGYFSATLPALDRAYLRPRYDGHLHFQDQAGDPVRRYLLNGGKPGEVLRQLDRLYAKSLQLSVQAAA